MKNKILTILLSVAISFALWAYVVSVEAPESKNTYYSVPVVLDGKAVLEQRGLILVGQKSFQVDLTLSGYRTDLKKLDSSNITVLADLSRITTAGTHELSYTISYPGSVQIDTVDQSPQQITVTVAERETKEIPVETYFAGEVPSNYNVDWKNVLMDHSTVTISGPKDVISRIYKARIDIDLSGRNQTFTEEYTYTLCNAAGIPVSDAEEVETNVSKVRATVRILQMKEVPLKLHLIPGGGLTEDMVTVEYAQPSIMVAGSEKDLLEFIEVSLGTINLNEITESFTKDYPIPLPEGITNVTGISSVSVTVTIPEMETREFTVTRFEAINVPEGMTVKFLTKQLTVQIRGPKALLDQLTADSVVVVVDFANIPPDSVSYDPIIEIRGVTGVGIVGNSGSIIAELVEAEAPPEE